MRRSTVGLVATLALAILLAPLVSDAQQTTKVHRIGWLRPDSPPSGPDPAMEDFRQGLRDLGYIEGQNLRIEYRYAAGSAERLHDLAAELVRRTSPPTWRACLWTSSSRGRPLQQWRPSTPPAPSPLSWPSVPIRSGMDWLPAWRDRGGTSPG
jgi:hypothetical protein